jgi:Zn-dependent protease
MNIVGLILWICIFLITVTIHEIAHGLIAFLCGDRTAYRMGRLTFNPLKHIDLFGTILLPVMLMMMGGIPIGMAKPVPVNYMALKNPKKDMVLVALAGPLTNLIFAWLMTHLLFLFPSYLLLHLIYFNIGIAVFNLMPIPPLDGGRVVAGLLPNNMAYAFGKIEPYGFLIVIALLYIGLLHKIIVPIFNFFCYVFQISSPFA